MNIILYHSPTAWPNKRWLAHMELAANCYMDFFGASEQEAKGKAEGFYAAEAERQRALVGSSLTTLQAPSEKLTSNEPRGQDYNQEGKGQYAIGKVWMINHTTKNRARVTQAEVKLMTEAGYVRGGPKTKWMED